MSVEKPIVRYDGLSGVAGGHAYLIPIDHPNHLEGHNVSNTRLVRTSKVIAFDEATGRIETQNTIYLPKERANEATQI